MSVQRTITAGFLWRKRANQALNWLFPNDEQLCILCGRPVPEMTTKGRDRQSQRPTGMCLFCTQDAALVQVQPERQRLAVAQAARSMEVNSCIPYDHFVRTMIRSWKYDGVIELTSWFADMLSEVVNMTARDAFDIVVPVPSTIDRTQKRGYDHVRLLTEELARTNRLHITPALTRRRTGQAFTQSQTAKSAVDRKRSLAKVYLHNKQIPVRGQRILLVDDIVTTGATLSACADVLYRAGVREITSLVIARVL